MANLVSTNIFCKNKEDFSELLKFLIQTGVLSHEVTMRIVDTESCSISFCSKYNVPFKKIEAISKLVKFDFYIEHAGDRVVDGVGEAVYRNGEVIDGADFYDDDSLDIAKIFLRVNGQDCYRYDQTSGEIVFIGGKNVDDDPDLAVIETTSKVLEDFLSEQDGVENAVHYDGEVIDGSDFYNDDKWARLSSLQSSEDSLPKQRYPKQGYLERKGKVEWKRKDGELPIEEWIFMIIEIFNIEQEWFIGDIQGSYISDGYMDSFGLEHFRKQVENEIAAYIKKEGCTDGYYSPFKATESSNKQCVKPFVLVSNKNKTVTFLSKKELEDLIIKEKENLLDKYQYFLQEELVAITGREIFFAEGTVESILCHRPGFTFLLNGSKMDGYDFLNELPKETLDRKAKMYFAPDVDEDYDAEIVIGK
jgi:hypothetical protein